MKKVIYIIALIGLVSLPSFKTYASTTTPAQHEFKSTEREINFDIERKQGGVTLYFQSNVFNTYDEIDVERCGENGSGYSTCKTIDVAKAKITGDYYVTTDNFPLPAQTGSSYRLKVIGKDGSVKVFPPVSLPALNK